MQIHRLDTASTSSPPEPGFTGEVIIADYFHRDSPSRLSGATVLFAPGSRTPWKLSPGGQTIVVISGSGIAQSGEDPIFEINPGDLIWFPPGVRHWEGATSDQALRYVALQEQAVVFGEAVTDAEHSPRRTA